MAFVLPRHNDAIHANPPGGDAHITTNASDWLWAVFAVMVLSWLVVMGWTFSSRRHIRIFHYIPIIVLAVATVTYFAMASDLGWAIIRSEFRSNPTRQVFYARYIQWFINAPLILLALLSFTHLATAVILAILFFSWFLVVNGLIGALVASSYKWGFFVFGIFGLFFIWFALLLYVPLRRGAFAISEFKTGYYVGAAYISFIWMLYPICWGLSEGSNTISPTSEMVFYGVLDIMSGPIFLFGFMAYLSDFSDQQLRSTAFGTTERGEEPQTVQKQPLPQTVQAQGPPGQTGDA